MLERAEYYCFIMKKESWFKERKKNKVKTWIPDGLNGLKDLQMDRFIKIQLRRYCNSLGNLWKIYSSDALCLLCFMLAF